MPLKGNDSMLQPKIFVTGATGSTGNETLKILSSEGYPVPVLIRQTDRFFCYSKSYAKAFGGRE